MVDSRLAIADGGTTDSELPEEGNASENADRTGEGGSEEPSTEQLRQSVEERYDFDSFGADEMGEMSPREWDAAFDPDSWITGERLLDRIEDDLKRRIAEREVFAVLERAEPELLFAYSDSGYAIVDGEGTVEGRGTVLRDVKPTVALCSMEEYDVAEPPDGDALPEPAAVPEGGNERGNHMLQIVALAQLLAGGGLVVAAIASAIGLITFEAAGIGAVIGLIFVLIGAVLLLVVANARLSDRFRAEEYRDRLRAAGVGTGERPEFVPTPAEYHDRTNESELEARENRPAGTPERDDPAGPDGPRSTEKSYSSGTDDDAS